MTPRRILVAAWSVFVVFGYPGFMRADTLDELVDSRTGAITDWHSPMLTELWRVLGRVFSGPAPLFVLQGTMLLLGTYALVRRVLPERTAAYAASAALLFPPLIATTALISEASTLSAFLVTGAAVLLGESRARKLGGLALLMVACGLESGAAIAVLPIVVAGLRWPFGRWRQLGTAALAWLVIAGIAFGLDQLLVEERSHRREVALAMFDITGTLDHAGKLDDATIERELPGVALAVTTDIQTRARAAHSHPDKLARGDTRLFEPATTDAERDALMQARRSLSREMPMAYLRHRMHELSHVLGISRIKSWRPLFTEFVQNKESRIAVAHAAHHSLAQRILIWPVKKLGHTFLFRPYVYFFLGIVLLPLALVRRHGLAAMVLVSGIAYELALGIVTYTPNYNDSHWMMVATVIAAIVIAIRELEARYERVLEQAPLAVAHDDRA